MGKMFPVSLFEVLAGTPQTHQGLTVVPLFGPPTGPKVEVLHSAMNKKRVIVTEAEQPVVRRLLVHNTSKFPVIGLDGHELRGAKQNRVLNSSVVIAAGSSVSVPVSCIERGRWDDQSHTFTSSQNSSPSSMRRTRTLRVTGSLRHWDRHDACQETTWNEVETYSTRRQVRSQTRSLSDVIDADQEQIQPYVDHIPVQKHQTGMMCYINGTLVGVDLVGRPETYVQVHGQLLKSYAHDAVGQTASNAEQCAQITSNPLHVLYDIGNADGTTHTSAGMGCDVRIQANNIAASVLLVGGELVHMCGFPVLQVAQ